MKLVIYDDEGDVTKARLHATKLVQDKNCLAIIGPSITPSSMTVLQVTEKAKMPLISCAAAAGITAPAQDRAWTFKTAQTDMMAVARIYQYCQKHGITKVAILTVSSAFGVAGKGATPGPGLQEWHRSGGPGSFRG